MSGFKHKSYLLYITYMIYHMKYIKTSISSTIVYLEIYCFLSVLVNYFPTCMSACEDSFACTFDSKYLYIC